MLSRRLWCVALALWAAATLGAQAPPAAQVIKVVGERHKLVLRSDGAVVGGGDARAGQLGPMPADTKRRLADAGLVAIELPGKAIDIAAGDSTSYALLDDGTVVAWGSGRAGALGIGPVGTTIKTPGGAGGSAAPVKVSGLHDVTQIAAAGDVAIAVLRDGTVRAWGSRANGVIGDGLHPKRYGEGGPPALAPVIVPDATSITQVSTSGNHALALSNDGRVFSWGSNYHGALGREPRQELPIDRIGEVPGLTGVQAVAAGNGVSTVLKKDGTVWVWGANWHGQFGNGERTDPPGVGYGYELVPRPVKGIARVQALRVGLGGRHTLVLLADGTLRGWGNTTGARSAPAPPEGFSHCRPRPGLPV